MDQTFFGSFWKCVCILFIVLITLRILIPFFISFLHPPSFHDDSTHESTKWLDFIMQQIISRLQQQEILDDFNRSLSNCHIRSIGSAPSIPYVGTLKMHQPDDVRLLIPIQWINGPSFDFTASRNLTLEVDVSQIQCRIMVSWPGDNPRVIEIRFDREFAIKCDIGIRFSGGLGFSLTQIPLIGRIGTDLIVAAGMRNKIVLTLPGTNQ
jgi:hypothetical protein